MQILRGKKIEEGKNEKGEKENEEEENEKKENEDDKKEEEKEEEEEVKLYNLENSKPSTSSASKQQVSSNGTNGKKNGKKRRKKRSSPVGLLVKKPEAKKQKLEEFSCARVRSTSFTKRKGSNSSNDGKTTTTTNYLNSKDTNPLRSISLEGKDETDWLLTMKHSEAFQIKCRKYCSDTSVHPSGIEGIMDLVADVVMKDGSIKSILTEALKNEAPRILFDYYERAMEL
uniref:Uncharacterized protein n=1 Tax=Meloidogyne floridensis TaxID=298350 RepID=A0A915NJQ4_9BILA